MTPDQKKLIMRAIRKECIEAISICAEARIQQINESEISIKDLVSGIWENTERRLRTEGLSELLIPSSIRDYDPHHKIRTVIGSMTICVRDLKDDLPAICDSAKIQLWDKAWEEQKIKSKRVKLQDHSSLPKRFKQSQDVQSVVGGRSDISGTGMLMRTPLNARCTHLIGIPHEALVEGQRLGAGSYGYCCLYTIKSISFFPEHISYVGKNYKGGDILKYDSFQTEQGMQILHPSIVRCIGFTQEAPWITLFPYFNGGTLGDLMCMVPFSQGAFRRCMHRLHHGWKRMPPSEIQPSQIEHARIRAVVEHMPSIIHAIVDGVAAAHSAGVVHGDLHPYNIMLDFTRTNNPRIGIIDWGMMLRVPRKRVSINYVGQNAQSSESLAQAKDEAARELLKRPWLAPEMYDPVCDSAYTKASDIFALGFLIEMLVDFWRAARRVYYKDQVVSHPDTEVMAILQNKASTWMKIGDREARRSVSEVLLFFRESLKTDPNPVQRPLMELIPSFFVE